MKKYWDPLSDHPEVVERIRKLPEGSRLNLLTNSEEYFFLRVEEDNLVLLTKGDLGNMFTDPREVFFPLDKVDYNIESGQEKDILCLPSRSHCKPKRACVFRNNENYRKYVQILEGARI